MNANQIRAAIEANEVLTALAQDRNNDGQIAGLLSEGRTKLQPREITERGIRGILGDVEGARFMRLMKSIHNAASTDTVPAWLSAVLTDINRPEDTHVLTLDTMGIAFEWLKKDPGLDVGDDETQKLLDLIAAGYGPIDAAIPAACAAIKAAARVSDPVPLLSVSRALNGEDF